MDRWYVLDRKVRGPFTLRELLNRIEEYSRVCPAGKGEFKPAKQYPDLQRALQNRKSTLRELDREEEEKEPDMTPTLRRLDRIVQHATNKQLLREYEKFRRHYDAPELTLIEKEMRRRDLLSDEDSS